VPGLLFQSLQNRQMISDHAYGVGPDLYPIYFEPADRVRSNCLIIPSVGSIPPAGTILIVKKFR
jgi:hypothetical protein